MSGHTPGPWVVTYTRNGTANVGPSHNCTVAVLLISPVGEMEANARLIAAAPILLAELQSIANAKRFDREAFENDTAFVEWARSRAHWAITVALRYRDEQEKGE